MSRNDPACAAMRMATRIIGNRAGTGTSLSKPMPPMAYMSEVRSPHLVLDGTDDASVPPVKMGGSAGQHLVQELSVGGGGCCGGRAVLRLHEDCGGELRPGHAVMAGLMMWCCNGADAVQI